MSESSSLRVAIVGCGTHGAQCAALLEDARLVVACDRDPRRAAALAAKGHACFATNDLEEALSFLPHAVVVATPLQTVQVIVEAALRAGAHVFLDPYPEPKNGDLDPLLTLANATKRLLTVRSKDLESAMVAFLRKLRDYLAR